MGREINYYRDTERSACVKLCSAPRTKYIALTSVLVVLAFGTGIGIGFATKKTKTILNNSSEEGRPTVSNTTIPSPIITTTTRPSMITTTTGPSMITTTTTTTATSPPSGPCPPAVPQTAISNDLLSLDATITLTTFTKYSMEYTSPATVTTAMLMFEFETDWGSWYLDDVSMIENGDRNRELIGNGGFETGNLGSKWSFCDPRYPWISTGTVVSHTFHSGMYSYESQDPGVGSQEYLTQTFDIKSSTKYTIEFYVFYNGQISSAKATISSY